MGSAPLGARGRKVYAFGFQPWKRAYVRRYLAGEASRVVFVTSALHARLAGIRRGAVALVWGVSEAPATRALVQDLGLEVWRMEDGFLRSVGLGSDRNTPASLVVDRSGIYFDPTRPSDLESLLERGGFSAQELDRARALREQIVSMGVSKYNVGDRTVALPKAPEGRRVVLVPGQVEDDASIRLGTVDVRTNAELLRAARQARPDAFIIFKPHPDVESGNRKGKVPDDVAAALADAVVRDAPLPACLALAHEVHTMTSLVGFEALLRGLEVWVYGLPFYAGWGLCHDRHPHPRRTRRLSLDELVAGTLIRYPSYVHPETGRHTDAETIVALLRDQLTKRGGQPVRMSVVERKLMKAWNAVRGTFFDR